MYCLIHEDTLFVVGPFETREQAENYRASEQYRMFWRIVEMLYPDQNSVDNGDDL